MKLKIALSTATAVGLLAFAGAANAGGNTAYTDQQGQSNVGTIWQDGGTTNSDVGSAGNPILQDGSHNTLVIDQDGNKQKVSAGAGDDFEQNGAYNHADILQQASGNNLQTVYQGSDEPEATPDWRNELFVRQLGTNGLIGSVTQNNGSTQPFTGKNVATITQTANANTVEDVDQEGRHNSIVITEGGGAHNVIGNVYQGVRNGQSSERSTIDITIDGNNNGNVDAIGPISISGWTATGDGNDIDQAGARDASGHHVTANFTGNANLFDFLQYSDTINTITANVIGNWNQVGVAQGDSSSTSNVTINGSFNDVGIRQNGAHLDTGNLVTVNVNSDGNAAIASQFGGNNSMTINQ
jgi:hypothetical protein